MPDATPAPGRNRLAREPSPYLRQHAGNPVDWYPWGEEAFARARAEDKPIFLSIGYSTCHWCHVMAHESFENADLASVLNEHFVCVKVDREERPDIDALYMRSVALMTGSGGWPLSVFLTPSLRPFYGGTYFPPEDRQGMTAFRRVLENVAQAYAERREEIEGSAEKVLHAVARSMEPGPPSEVLGADASRLAREGLLRWFDEEEGGFGRGPKFPQPPLLDFLPVKAPLGPRQCQNEADHGQNQAAEANLLPLGGNANGQGRQQSGLDELREQLSALAPRPPKETQ